MCNEQLQKLYSSPSIIRVMTSGKMKGWAFSRNGEKRNGHRARGKETTMRTKS
jgi:hypothetical protein